MIRSAFALCVLCALAASVQAQTTTASSGTISLTPEQREAAIEAGAARARDESLQNGVSDRRVHGEVGVEVGSRGERSAYGTLVAPVGQNGVAAISYGTGQGPRWHRGRGRFHGSSVSAAYSNDADRVPAQAPSDAENVNPD
jgi:hypothetical protein